jgi:hypothetical protein
MLVPISYQICGEACNDGKGRAVPKSLPQLWAMVVVSRQSEMPTCLRPNAYRHVVLCNQFRRCGAPGWPRSAAIRRALIEADPEIEFIINLNGKNSL